MQIICRLFGSPSVFIEDKQIQFPYKKAEALFYYLLTVSTAARQELSSLLWPELSEVSAKKNLRNALYKIKGTFGDEKVLITEKSSVRINPDIDIICDINDFSGDNSDMQSMYYSEFLKDFSVKNSSDFEQWLHSKREYYLQRYVDMLKNKTCEFEENKNWKMMEKFTKKLIEIDEFDERAYAGLIKSYQNQRAYDKGINTYKKLEKLLLNELGIKPDTYTAQIFNSLLDVINAGKNKAQTEDEKMLFDRYSELRVLEKAYEEFEASSISNAVIVSGERGSGKTALLEKFLDKVNKLNISKDNGENSKEVSVLKLRCMKDEINQPFRAWKTLMMQKLQQSNIEDKKNSKDIVTDIVISFSNNMQNITDALTDVVISFLFADITSKSYLIYVDDIQFIDEESLSLMTSILTNFSNIMMIAACDSSGIDKIETRFSSSQKIDKISMIKLKRWSRSEISGIINDSLDEKQQSLINAEHMLYNTRGIAVFVQDYIAQIKQGNDIQILSEEIKSYLTHMILDITEDERLVLEAASFFSEDADFDMLRLITDIEDDTLSSSIDSLCKKNLLCEQEKVKDEKFSLDLIYAFNYPKLCEYVYSSMSMTRRRTVHQKIAEALEKKIMQMPSDMALYHRLIFHFIKANDKKKALDYSVKSLNRYLNYSHELFPILFAEDQALLNSGYISTSATMAYLEDIEKLLIQVKKEGGTKEYQISRIAFLHMKGRYLIREANYEEGTKLIKEMIEMSLEIQDDDYTLEGYKQMIYYCIQTGESEQMQDYIKLALDIAIKHNYHKETGILLRFRGLYHMLRGEYEKAEQMLQSSVGTFTISDEVADKYALNIAAAYNYIGEIKRLLNHHEKAKEYYQKAIDIGIAKEAVTSLMVFYINAGQNAYQSGNKNIALKYFQKADICRGRADIHWKKSILNAYTGLLEIENALRENETKDNELYENETRSRTHENDNYEYINKMQSYENGIKKIKQANEQALKMRNPQEIKTAAWALEQAELIKTGHK